MLLPKTDGILDISSVGPSVDFFLNLRFLKAFALKVHILVEFFLEPQIKLTSASGAV